MGRQNDRIPAMNNDSTTVGEVGPRPKRGAIWAGVVFAIVFPSIVTWIYFVLAADWSPAAQRVTGGVLKSAQFLFPIVWTLVVLGQGKEIRSLFSLGGTPLSPRHRAWLARRDSSTPSAGSFGRATLSRRTGIVLGIAFGLAVTLGGWMVYRGLLGDSPLFLAAAEKMRAKIAGFGLDSTGKYVALGVFYSFVHSFLEEYYWRWFVFGQLRRLVPLWPAIVVSALGFMAHHVIVLGSYFGGLSWITLLLSSAVAIGGGFWAWLYDRSGSLLGPWLSHLLVDAGIFFVGYALVRSALAGAY
jgi:CAAX protease family protein